MAQRTPDNNDLAGPISRLLARREPVADCPGGGHCVHQGHCRLSPPGGACRKRLLAKEAVENYNGIYAKRFAFGVRRNADVDAESRTGCYTLTRPDNIRLSSLVVWPRKHHFNKRKFPRRCVHMQHCDRIQASTTTHCRRSC
ncbi:hypothetical protein CHELA40_50717 [Chelatococcus asaccharovorans]|nr:hypothetical protein CHELA40_50717 [Chelatococcus asaccharovorans]